MQKVLIIVGPTASGKSALGVALARRFKGEILSADSRQVYKGLDIGTGKITKREMKGVPHHLLDIASPKRTFTAGEFVRHGRRALDMIYHTNKLPVVVGGTGLYIDALMGRIVLPDVAPNLALRKRLAKKSAAHLFVMLKGLDPRRAKMLSTQSERNNKVRLIRALEIAGTENRSREICAENGSRYDALWIGVKPDDNELRAKINKRLAERLKDGMVKEARKLHKQGLSYKRMRELGLEYRSLARYLQGITSRYVLEKELQSDIWRYARKQIGYWKRNKEIRWLDPKSKKIVPLVKVWLKNRR